MRFHVSLLVKARNNSQSEKNILIFKLKSAFSTLILHSVTNLKTVIYKNQDEVLKCCNNDCNCYVFVNNSHC